ncbi:MAG: RDD family protein [Bacteroidota bacterium]
MDSIKISTTQNVELEYEAAGLGYRLLATVLDGIFIGVYIGIVVLCFGLAGWLNRGFLEDNQFLLMTLSIIFGLPVLLYHFLSETFMNGQSLGKKIMGIKVIKLDGTQPGVSSYMLRSLFRIIDIQILNGLVAIISIPVSEKSQRIGDMAAGTTVIRKDSAYNLRDTILYREIPGYTIVFHQVSLLADKDVAIIKEILDHSLQNKKPQNLKLLADKVKRKMGVNVPWKDEDFLKTVLLDYSHYQFNA